MDRSFSAVYRGVAVKSNVAKNGQKIVHAKLLFSDVLTLVLRQPVNKTALVQIKGKTELGVSVARECTLLQRTVNVSLLTCYRRLSGGR